MPLGILCYTGRMFESLFDMLGLGGSPESVKPPVVGISGGNADSASVRAMFTQIQSAGAIPIFLGNHAQRSATEDIDKIDVLVVMGNDADIDPERYGQAKHEKTKSESATPEGKARAEYEYQLMQLAIEKKMPLLGVCGGMQRLNVMCGGTLNQNIADVTGNDDHAQQDHNIAPFTPVQLVRIEPGSTLGDISREVSAVYTPTHAKVPLTGIMENSMHHQCVDKVGEGLRLCGASIEPDKNGDKTLIPEAIEADPNGRFGGQFLLGVQWHPEFSASPLGKYIAERVVQEGQEFAKKHGREHPVSEAIEENQKSMLPMLKDAPNAKVGIGSMTEHILARRQPQMLGSRGMSA